MRIKLGDKVCDPISGFEGIVTARTEWLYGCIRVGVTAERLSDKGLVMDAQWFDEPQVEFIEVGTYYGREPVTPKKPKKNKNPFRGLVTGGPARESDPGH